MNTSPKNFPKMARMALAASLILTQSWLGAPAPIRADEQAPNAAPDLSITKTGTQPNGSGQPGPTLFTVRYKNMGTAEASGIRITETIAAGMQFEQSLSSPWTCNDSDLDLDNNSGEVCYIDILEPLPADPIGAQPVQTLTFAITPTNTFPPQIDSVTNVVVIADDGTHGADANPANNTGTAAAMIGAQTTLAATQVAKLVTDANSNGKYDAGDVIEYTFAITNTGLRYANALRLVSDFSPDWNVQVVAGSVSASPSVAVSNTATSAYALFGNIAPGSSVVASFRLSGSTEPPLNLPAITHVGALHDSYGFNANSSLTTVPIQHSLIAVAATKAGSIAPSTVVSRGAKLSYTFAVTNTGAEGIANLQIVDAVSDGGGKAACFSVVTSTVTTSRGTANVTHNGITQTVEVAVGALAPGESVNVGFDAIVRGVERCTQVINQASVYSGALLLADTNSVSNPIEPYVPPVAPPTKMFLPLIRRA